MHVRRSASGDPLDTSLNDQSCRPTGGWTPRAGRHRRRCRVRLHCRPAAVAAPAADLRRRAAARSIRSGRAARRPPLEAAARRSAGRASHRCRRGCHCSIVAVVRPAVGRGSPDIPAPARNSGPGRRSSPDRSNCCNPCRRWSAARPARRWRSRHNLRSRCAVAVAVHRRAVRIDRAAAEQGSDGEAGEWCEYVSCGRTSARGFCCKTAIIPNRRASFVCVCKDFFFMPDAVARARRNRRSTVPSDATLYLATVGFSRLRIPIGFRLGIVGHELMRP